MTIDIEVISKQMIKPSIPTPDHCRRYQFSFLDQIAPPIHVPFIYFYNLDDHQKLSNNDILNRLKMSLSKVLTHYYPFAGRFGDNYVDCNDEGVLFLEAKLSCKLSEFTREPLSSDLNKLLLPNSDKQDGLLLGIQVNFFSCGGTVAIGAIFSHKIADGCAFFTFMKNWAATASSGNDDFQCPEVFAAAAEIFPPKDIGWLKMNQDFLSTEGKIVFKRFVFSSSMLAALRKKYADDGTSSGRQIHPTRVQALSAFIWNRFAVSTEAKIGSERPWKLMHTVNLRKRMDQDQPVPDDSVGNIAWGAAVLANNSHSVDVEPTAMVKKMRNAISQVNKVSVLEQISYIVGLSDQTLNKNKKQEVPAEVFFYTSLCRFPSYEADFGWGTPQWVAWGGIHKKNFVALVDTKDGDGIEAWIHLTEENMAKFEADKELLAFASSIS